MQDSESSQSKSWVSKLLEQQSLEVILLIVFMGLMLLICIIVFIVFGTYSLSRNRATPTQAVGFATPTSSAAGTPTSESSGSPSIALLPVQGDAGTLITITGKNWPPNETVEVRIDDPTGGQTLQPLVTNSTIAGNGTFIASFLLPAGTGWMDLASVQVSVRSRTGNATAAAEFSIIPPSPGATPGAPATATSLPAPGDDDDNVIILTPTTEIIPSIGEWQAEYYNNTSLIGAPAVIRNEVGVDFDWGFGAPAPSLPVDGFSGRWVRPFDLGAGLYIFHVTADDGVRLWIDGDLIIEEWYPTPRRDLEVEYVLPFDDLYEVRLEYADFSGPASIYFWFEKVALPPPDTGIPYYSWRGAYWPNVNLFGDPLLVRSDPSVSFDWGTSSPAPGIPANSFSARWDRIIDFEPASYRFTITVDDGARLYVDNQLIIDEWQDGNTRTVSRDYALSGGPHEVRVEYYDRTGNAEIEFLWSKTTAVTPTPTATAVYSGWRGEYWPNQNLAGDPTIVRNDPVINFNWGLNAPDSALPANNFSVRWTRSINFSEGLYRFTTEFNDGIRFYIDGSLVLSEWSDTPVAKTRTIDLNLNGFRQLRVEYYDSSGNAEIKFDSEKLPPTTTPSPTASPTTTVTATGTATSPATSTSTATSTATPTGTATTTATTTTTATATVTSSTTPSVTTSPTVTNTPTLTPTATLVASPTLTATTEGGDSGGDLPVEIPSN